jgi:hypothetical protein
MIACSLAYVGFRVPFDVWVIACLAANSSDSCMCSCQLIWLDDDRCVPMPRRSNEDAGIVLSRKPIRSLLRYT